MYKRQDSLDSSDDTVGIKTWFNERYVKDTSRKIRCAISARQKEGTLITKPPFGYCRDEKDKSIIKIVPEEADYVRLIFDLYISGYGYRKILLKVDVPNYDFHLYKAHILDLTKLCICHQD